MHAMLMQLTKQIQESSAKQRTVNVINQISYLNSKLHSQSAKHTIDVGNEIK